MLELTFTSSVATRSTLPKASFSESSACAVIMARRRIMSVTGVMLTRTFEPGPAKPNRFFPLLVALTRQGREEVGSLSEKLPPAPTVVVYAMRLEQLAVTASPVASGMPVAATPVMLEAAGVAEPPLLPPPQADSMAALSGKIIAKIIFIVIPRHLAIASPVLSASVGVRLL